MSDATTFTPDFPISLRSRIMGEIATRFKNVVAGQNGFTIDWNSVMTQPVNKAQQRAGDTVAIFDVTETKKNEIGYTDCRIGLQIEFYVKNRTGDDPPRLLDQALLDVQRTLFSDITCGGLALNIVEVKNEKDVDGYSDTIVAGVLTAYVAYRHKLNNPHLPR